MKFLILSLSILLASTTAAQVLEGKISGLSLAGSQLYTDEDTIPRVVYLEKRDQTADPILFIDETPAPYQALSTLNFSKINGMDIKKDKESEGIYKHGEIHITFKDNYSPSLITLKT